MKKKHNRFDTEFSDFYFTESDLNGKVLNTFKRKYAGRFADYAKSLKTPCHIHSVYSINFVDSYQTDANGFHPIVHIVQRPIDFYVVSNDDELNKVLEQTGDKNIKVVNKRLHPVHPYKDDSLDLSLWCYFNRTLTEKKHVR